MAGSYRTIHRTLHHFGWDNSFPPFMEAAPGDVIEFDIIDSSGGQLTASAGPDAIAALNFAQVNPVAGPIAIAGAEPGDTLIVEIIDFALSPWGWTGIIPGFGLLADEFKEPYLHISRYDRDHVWFTPDIRLPTRPFPGTVGVAPAEDGLHSIVPPRAVGGNMDIRDLVRGARLRLPVAVPRALFSIGDTHAAQGDGEVCGTAIETSMRVKVRFGLEKKRYLQRPQIEVPAEPPCWSRQRGTYITTGIAPDLMQAARDATRDMIEHLVYNYRLDEALAYCLCSVAVDLHISEVVDAPNWLVTAHLPTAIFH